MSSNPYLDSPIPLVENDQTQTTEILDARTGARLITGLTNTTAVVDAQGGRHFAQRQIRVRGDDGRLINPADQLYACSCGCGLDLLTTHTVRFCAFCQAPLHLTHLRTWDDGTTKAGVCPACWEPGHTNRAIKRFLVWLLNI